MITTQRFILFILFLNLIIGISGAVYEDYTTYNNDIENYYSDFSDDVETEFESDNNIWGAIKSNNNNRNWESTIGNPINWGYQFMRIFIQGLNPFGINPLMFNTTIEKSLAWVLILFRSFSTILLAMEAYMFIKNRKTS